MWGHQLGRRTGSTNNLQGRSWYLSVLFSTNQLFQELLFQLVLLKRPTDFQRLSNSFPTSFKTISNQITSPLFKTLYPRYVQMTLPQSKKLNIYFFFKVYPCKIARYFKVENLPNVLEGRNMCSMPSCYILDNVTMVLLMHHPQRILQIPPPVLAAIFISMFYFLLAPYPD